MCEVTVLSALTDDILSKYSEKLAKNQYSLYLASNFSYFFLCSPLLKLAQVP